MTQASPSTLENGAAGDFYLNLGLLKMDAGEFRQAVSHFQSCTKLCEVGALTAQAKILEAKCWKELGSDLKFVLCLLAARDIAPLNTEAPFFLAKYYREQGKYEEGLLFAKAGLEIFEESGEIGELERTDYYNLLSEFSILARYSQDEAIRDRGYSACEQLSLSRAAQSDVVQLARHNLVYYRKSAKEILPSLEYYRIDIAPPPKFYPLNPSITIHQAKIFVNVRCVNYYLKGNRLITPDENFKTRNFLLQLDERFNFVEAAELFEPSDMPDRLYRTYSGFEDLRIFSWKDALWAIASSPQFNESGHSEMILCKIEQSSGSYCLSDMKFLSERRIGRHEKNWMPLNHNEKLKFLYSAESTIFRDDDGNEISRKPVNLALDHIRGSSQLLPFDNGYLGVVHEAVNLTGGRNYMHRFIYLDSALCMSKMSRPFNLLANGVEFVSGAAIDHVNNRLIISFGVGDCEAWLATLCLEDLRAILEVRDC